MKILFSHKFSNILGILLLLLALGIAGYIFQSTTDTRSLASGESVKLVFNPESTTQPINAEFTTKINIDTNSLPITGVDLTFNIDSNTLSFISFTPTTKLNSPLINTYDPTTKLFRFASVDTSSNQISGVIELGSLKLKSIAQGSSQITLTKSQVTMSSSSTSIPVVPSNATIQITSNTNPEPKSTVTSTTQNPKLNLNISLHGIGKSGDRQNSLSKLGKPPKRPTRDIQLTFSKKGSNATTTSITLPGKITYNNKSGSFTGTIDLGTSLQASEYNISVKIPNYISETKSPVTTQIKPGTTTNIPNLTFITGDINNDKELNVLDYNFILDCYSDLRPAKSCNTDKKSKSDINDDGVVNAVDYNLFLRESKI